LRQVRRDWRDEGGIMGGNGRTRFGWRGGRESEGGGRAIDKPVGAHSRVIQVFLQPALYHPPPNDSLKTAKAKEEEEARS
jgi:hypothetical protein